MERVAKEKENQSSQSAFGQNLSNMLYRAVFFVPDAQFFIVDARIAEKKKLYI